MMTAEEALKLLLETSERIAIYKMADGTLSIPGRRFREAQNEARKTLGIPPRPIRDRPGIFVHSGTNSTDIT